MIDLNEEPNMKTGINSSVAKSLQQTPKLEKLKEFHDKLEQSENDILELKQRMLLHEAEDLTIPPGDQEFVNKYKFYTMGNYKG